MMTNDLRTATYFTLVTTRGQRSIPHLIINPTRGQYHSNGTPLIMSVEHRNKQNIPNMRFIGWSSVLAVLLDANDMRFYPFLQCNRGSHWLKS